MSKAIVTQRTNDNIYINVVFNHPSTQLNVYEDQGLSFPFNIPLLVNDEIDVNAEYNSTKTLPLVDRASDYYLSIIRFDIPLDQVPLFVMPIVPNQNNPNLTPFIIGIQTNSVVNYSLPIYYNPDNVLTPPVQNLPGQQVVSPYYYVFFYNNLIQTINANLITIYNALGQPGSDGFAPYFEYQPNGYITLIVGLGFQNQGYNIYGNAALINYFDGLRVTFQGWNQPNGVDYIFNINPYPANSNAIVVPVSGYTPGVLNGLQFNGEYTVVNMWTGLRKIVLKSKNLPISKEFIPSYNENGTQNDLAASLQILTDFVPELSVAGDTRTVVYYNPTSQYRLVDLLTDDPIYTVDVQVYWEDVLGNLYPLELSSLQSASVKMAFVRKSLYKNQSLALRK